MITENMQVHSLQGRTYNLGKMIGSGGEGNVYLVQGTNLVAKIMRKAIPGQETKMCYMVNHPIPDLPDSTGVPILRMAWPTDVLYGENGQYVGYTMPYIEGGVEIFEIDRGCRSQRAMELFPAYNWGLNVHVAYHLALAVDYLHKQGCVIGDMNCKNILVNANRSIIILDVDSFDIQDEVNHIHYKCAVGTEDYLAPELQGRNLRMETAQFNEQTDDFALAVHIFQLLMDNYHPFSCRQLISAKNSSHVNPRLEQIVSGKSPYIRKYQDVDIPLGAPTIRDILPAYVHQLFVDAFSYDKDTLWERIPYRPSAEAWVIALARMQNACEAEGGLVQCERDVSHFYLRSKHCCGFCNAKQRANSFNSEVQFVDAVQVGRTEARTQTPSKNHTGKENDRTLGQKRGRGLWFATALLMAMLLGYAIHAITTPDNSVAHMYGTGSEETYGQRDTATEVATTAEATAPVSTVPVATKPASSVPVETQLPTVTIKYWNGVYTGTVKGGVPDGEGTLLWDEGSFEGEFRNGYPEGDGTFSYASDSGIASVSGRWSYGEAELEYEDGMWKGDRYAQYRGMLLQTVPCGYGNLDLSEGNSYSGTFANGHPEGRGSYYYADGTKTSGIFTWGKDIKMQLHSSRSGGTMYYTGMMKQNVPSGYGTLVFEKGGAFYGEFYLGSVEGAGVYVFRTSLSQNYDTIYGDDWSLVYGQHSANYPGYEYSGLVLHGSWQGYGLGITPKKYHYVGEVRDNIRSGYGRLYTPDNQIYQEGMFSEGYLVK